MRSAARGALSLEVHSAVRGALSLEVHAQLAAHAGGPSRSLLDPVRAAVSWRMSSDELELPPRGMITLFRRPLWLDEHGLRLGKKHIAWDDVEFYTYTWEDGFLAGDIYIVSRDDRWMRIDDRYYYWRQAADRILAELHPRLRADPDLHPFQLTATELRHVRFGTLALADIDRAEIAPSPDGPALAIYDRRSPTPWSLDGLGKVHSVVLLLDELVARGVALRALAPLWLPPSAGHLAEDVAGQVDLPAAHVIRR